jgi:hypothetical protein
MSVFCWCTDSLGGGVLENREECDDAVTVAHATIDVTEMQMLFRFKMVTPFELTHMVYISFNTSNPWVFIYIAVLHVSSVNCLAAQ